jgi:type I restriction enzyme M protein
MTPSIDKVVEDLWNQFWAGGVGNPLSALEQISYMILLKRLDQQESRLEDQGLWRPTKIFENHLQLRWHRLRGEDGQARYSLLDRELIPFLQEEIDSPGFRQAMEGAVFALPTPRLVDACMRAIDDLDFDSHDPDFQGEVFEELLRQLQLAGRNSQFITPRHLTRAIVELLDPRPGEVFCDPVAGTAGFVVEAYRHACTGSEQAPPDADFLAFDQNPGMARLGAINMILHGIEQPEVERVDTLSRHFRQPQATVVAANPPFGGAVDRSNLHPDLSLNTNRSELLFFDLCRHLLRPGGRAAVIVSESVLFGESRAHVEVRRNWLQKTRVDAVVLLPAGVFLPFTRIKTAIVYATAAEPAEEVLFCQIRDEKQTFDLKREGLPHGDLEFMARAVRARLNDEEPEVKGARDLARRIQPIPIAEMADNRWSLAPSTYERAARQPLSESDPLQLLERVEELHDEMQEQIERAKETLEEPA